MYLSCGNVFSEDNILTLTVTRRCNLSCRNCPLLKKRCSMLFSTAKQSLSLFSNSALDPGGFLIRLFGGEPLLEFETVKKIYVYSKKVAARQKRPVFLNLTTNGLLLTEEKINFFRSLSNFEIIVNSNTFSNRGGLSSLFLLSHLSLNFFIDRHSLRNLEERFFNFLRLGFRSFNFLPSYFAYWDQVSIRKIASALKRISIFINKFGADFNIKVKNKFNLGSVPLFNQNVTVDCNGDIFPSNVFLAKPFIEYAKEFKLGNVNSVRSFESIKRMMRNADLGNIVKKCTPFRVLKSTHTIDNKLTEFISTLN
ncbi:MAG: radical SAM protein [Candidatus Omnitrophota bacterium]